MTVESTAYILPLADPGATLKTVGGKGASLARLVAAGLPVPDGFHVTTTAYRRFVAENDLQSGILAALQQIDINHPVTLEAAATAVRALFAEAQMPPLVARAITAAYAGLAEQNPVVVVRSSATAEDLPEASFAGQQDTFLNIQGIDAVLAAVKQCWASLWTARAIGYRGRQGIEPEGLSLAVVVQTLVPAEAAGILFTANPVTGNRRQAMISAAWGLGEAVVGGLVTPDTFVVDKATSVLLERQIADKQVMTVCVDGGTEEQPIPEDKRHAPALNDEAAIELARLGVQIEELYQMPMDIEWTWADGAFAIVQARPITALPIPEPVPPSVWDLPPGMYAAMRNNIVELMIDPLSPLFRTLGLTAVNASMNRTLAAYFGHEKLMPDELIISVNQYAYYNGSLSAGQIGRVLLRSGSIARHMFTGAIERWTEDGRPRYIATVNHWQAQPWPAYTAVEIIDAVRALTEAAIDAYMALVAGVIPAAWISEGIFTKVYNILIKRRDDPLAQTYLLGFDSIPIRAEKALFDLAQWARAQPNLARFVTETLTPNVVAQLESDQAPPEVTTAEWHALQHRFQTHLDRYGHTIYNLDFANPVPADDPAPILEIFRMFVNGEGVNPHQRQENSAARRQQVTAQKLAYLKRLRLKLFRKLVTTAQRYAPLREDGLAEVGLSYPLLRQMLREVGRRFMVAGVIAAPDDIFWLEDEEVMKTAVAIDNGETVPSLAAVVPQRKAEWRAARSVSPPRGLMKFFGINLSQMASRRRGRGKTDTVKGVGASPGQVTGPARVLHGPEEFEQMQTGDVLVAPLTTPAWTPLFARAAAIVTDVGGPLSHGSIVAREYGIPAVLGTGNATTIIQNDQMITVDGTSGKVMLSV